MIRIVPSQENDTLAVELSALLGVSILPFDEPTPLVFDDGSVLINLSGENNPYIDDVHPINVIDILDIAQVVHMQKLPQTTHSYAQVARKLIGEFHR